MARLPDLTARIRVDDRDLDRARQKLGQFGGAVGGASSSLGGLAKQAAVLGGTAVLARFFGDAIAGAEEAARLSRITEQAIRSTGGAANVTADDVANLSSSLSKKVAVDDEVIQSSANLLLTFTKIRNEVGEGNNIFDRATAATQDLAARGFGDADSAAKGLGKALNDPIKGITALSRAGVTFTEQQRTQIRVLVESGRTLEAQRIILEEIETQVGGSAEAAASGLDRARVAAGELAETAGGVVAPALNAVAGGLASLPQGAQAGVVGLTGLAVALPAISSVSDAVSNLRTKMDLAAGGSSRLSAAIGTLGRAGLVAGVLVGLSQAADALSDKLGASGRSVEETAQKLLDIGSRGTTVDLAGLVGGDVDALKRRFQVADDAIIKMLTTLNGGERRRAVAAIDEIDKALAFLVRSGGEGRATAESLYQQLGEVVGVELAGKRLDEYRAAIAGADVAARTAVGGVGALGDEAGELGGELEEAAVDLAQLGRQGGLTEERLRQLARTMGVDLAAATDEQEAQVRKAAEALAEAVTPAQRLAAVEETLANRSATTSESLKATSEALNAIVGSGLDAASATAEVDARVQDLAAGAEKLADAERGLWDAQEASRQAQDDLNRARQEAPERLEELGFAAEGAALSEARALRALEDARKEVQRTATFLPTSRRRRDALAALEEADLAVRQARDRREDTERELSERARLGIEGDPEVVSARRAAEVAAESERRARSSVDEAITSQEALRAKVDAVIRALQAEGEALIRSGQLLPEDRFAAFRDRLAEIRDRFPEIAGRIDPVIAKLNDLERERVVTLNVLPAIESLAELDQRIRGLPPIQLPPVDTKLAQESMDRFFRSNPGLERQLQADVGTVLGAQGARRPVGLESVDPLVVGVPGRSGLQHQVVDARRTYHVDTVVAQDPNAVIAEVDRRERAAALAGY